MLAHIGIDANPFAVTNPFKGFRQIILSFHIPLDIVAPFLRFRILGITKHSFGCIYEFPRVDGVEQFLLLERNAHNVDGLEPLLDFFLFAFTFIYE